MLVRYTTETDLKEIMDIYAYARKQMKQNGNPDQWGDDRPSLETIRNDIKSHTSHCIVENGIICGISS